MRLDGIGDALCLAPLIRALADAGHELGALLTTRNAHAYAPGTFARVHVVERIPWPRHGSTPASADAARAAARAARYDVALVASEEPEAYRFARAAGARTRVGFLNGWEKPLKSLWTAAQLTRPLVRGAHPGRIRAHEVEILFRLGDGLHAEPEPTRETARLRPLVAADAPATRDPHVAVQIAPKRGDGGPAQAVAIARAVAARGPAVVVGAVADDALVGAVAREAGVEARVFAEVGDWRAALVRMRAVVTPDSGAAHLAGLAGVPCVDLFAPGPYAARDVARWRPWAGPSRTLILGPEASGNARAVVASLDELEKDGG